jgi:hypothetical protein
MDDLTQAIHASAIGTAPTCLLCGGSVQSTGAACGDRPELLVRRCEGCGLMDFSHTIESHCAADDYFPLDEAAIYAREAPWNAKRIERNPGGSPPT